MSEASIDAGPEATIVPFDPSLRDRSDEADRRVTMEALAARQGTIAADECHVVLTGVSKEVGKGRRRHTVLCDLDVGIPKGRKIVLLGHQSSGKTTLLDLLNGSQPATHGRVVHRSRVSWPVHMFQFFDMKLPVRDNLIFVARVLLRCAPSALIRRAVVFGEMEPAELQLPFQSLSVVTRRRLAYLVVLMANFDLHLMDQAFKAQSFGFSGGHGTHFEELGTDRDFVMSLVHPGQIPNQTDLLYILYNGRLFMFEDVAQGVEVFKQLPVPQRPDPTPRQDSDGAASDVQIGMV